MSHIKHILCPVDFFPTSERAMDFAIDIARRHHAKLTLLHVVSFLMPGAYEVPIATQSLIDESIRSAEEVMKTLAAKAERAGVPAVPHTCMGYADDEIQKYVLREKVELLAMGTHGRRGLERFFLGSTTERLLRTLQIPMLIVGTAEHKEPVSLSFRRMLVASDLSAGTADAMTFAASLAGENKSEIIVLHALDDIAGELARKYRLPLMRGIRETLRERIPAEVSAKHQIDVRVLYGTPYDLVLKTIRGDNIGLLVVNVHNKTRLERIEHGPTIEAIIRAATCPVLIVPTGITGYED